MLVSPLVTIVCFLSIKNSFVLVFKFPHINDVYCLSLSELLHFTSPGPFMLLQIALFHSFLWLSNISLYICMCVCVCMYTYTYIISVVHMCICTHMYIYTYIHKHTFVLLAKLCPTLLWPHGLHSLLGSSVHWILQAGILEWVAISYSRGSCWPRYQTCVSGVSCVGRQILYHWATWEDWILIHTTYISIHVLMDT